MSIITCNVCRGRNMLGGCFTCGGTGRVYVADDYDRQKDIETEGQRAAIRQPYERPKSSPPIHLLQAVRRVLVRKGQLGELVVYQTADDRGLTMDEYVELITDVIRQMWEEL